MVEVSHGLESAYDFINKHLSAFAGDVFVSLHHSPRNQITLRFRWVEPRAVVMECVERSERFFKTYSVGFSRKLIGSEYKISLPWIGIGQVRKEPKILVDLQQTTIGSQFRIFKDFWVNGALSDFFSEDSSVAMEYQRRRKIEAADAMYKQSKRRLEENTAIPPYVLD